MDATTPDETSEALTIRGVDFAPAGFPREFRKAELEIYQELAEKHDLRALRREYDSIAQYQAIRGVNARVESAWKRVDAIEKRLERVLEEMAEDPDGAWDEERVQALVERFHDATEHLKEVSVAHLAEMSKHAGADRERASVMLEKMDEANMRVAHAIGKHHKLDVGKITDWLRDPTNADLTAAATLVETGLTALPTIRAQRRAAQTPWMRA